MEGSKGVGDSIYNFCNGLFSCFWSFQANSSNGTEVPNNQVIQPSDISARCPRRRSSRLVLVSVLIVSPLLLIGMAAGVAYWRGWELSSLEVVNFPSGGTSGISRLVSSRITGDSSLFDVAEIMFRSLWVQGPHVSHSEFRRVVYSWIKWFLLWYLSLSIEDKVLLFVVVFAGFILLITKCLQFGSFVVKLVCELSYRLLAELFGMLFPSYFGKNPQEAEHTFTGPVIFEAPVIFQGSVAMQGGEAVQEGDDASIFRGPVVFRGRAIFLGSTYFHSTAIFRDTAIFNVPVALEDVDVALPEGDGLVVEGSQQGSSPHSP